MNNKPKEKKESRVPLMMTPSELKAVDDWMFERRIRSRCEAIRRLIALGLRAEEPAVFTRKEVGDLREELLSIEAPEEVANWQLCTLNPLTNRVLDILDRVQTSESADANPKHAAPTKTTNTQTKKEKAAVKTTACEAKADD